MYVYYLLFYLALLIYFTQWWRTQFPLKCQYLSIKLDEATFQRSTSFNIYIIKSDRDKWLKSITTALFMKQAKSVLLTTALLVTPIITVWNAITFVCFLNALLEIRTLKLCCRARDGRTALFILVVKAVIISITNPRLRNAVSWSGTCELEQKQ